MGMKKSDLLAVYGSLAAVGRVFAPVNGGKPISRAAVHDWGKEIPPLRAFQLVVIDPEIHQKIASAKRRQVA